MALLLYVGLAMGVLPIFGLITNQWVAKVLVAQIAWEWDGVAATHCGAVAGAAGVAPGTPSQRVVFLDGAPDKAMLFEAGQPVGGKPFRKWTKDDFKQSKPRFLRMVACHAG